MRKVILRLTTQLAVGLLAVALLAGPSLAADITVELAAVEAQWLPPGGTAGDDEIPMWGFVTVPDPTDFSCPDPASPPDWSIGPRIQAIAGDNITINLRNCLDEAVSIFIPGQSSALSPVFSGNRVTSLAPITPANSGATIVPYVWNGVEAGTHIYHSGSNLAKQVQMGLYGALTVDFSTGVAYNETDPVNYDNEVVLFFSEIDPARHDPPAPAYPNAYTPRYFLANGQPYVDLVTTPIPIGAVSQTTLVRMLSACLDDIVPTINGMHWDLIAEDGNRYLYAKTQYTALLSAMKTKDAILVPTANGVYAVFDRRLNLTNAAAAPGGMLVQLQVGAAALTAVDDSETTLEETPLFIDVLANDNGTVTAVDSVTQPSNGTATINADNTVTYTPNTNFFGSDFFTYKATDGTNISNPATVTVTVSNVNDLPVAVDDGYEVTEGTTLTVPVPGVLENDSDPDGDALIAVLDTNVTGGQLTLNNDGSFTYTPNSGTTSDSFTYFANDSTANSTAPATVTITVTAPPANQPPVANPDFATTQRNTAVTIDLTLNDTDPDGNLDPASVDVGTVSSRGGTITNLNNGSVVYTPRRNFRGTDTFTYTVADTDGERSGQATVTVNVVK